MTDPKRSEAAKIAAKTQERRAAGKKAAVTSLGNGGRQAKRPRLPESAEPQGGSDKKSSVRQDAVSSVVSPETFPHNHACGFGYTEPEM